MNKPKRTLEEIHGEDKAREIRKKLSIASSGENNSRFGTHPTEETIKKLRERKLENHPRYWLGKKRLDTTERLLKNNPMKNKETAKKSGNTKSSLYEQGLIKSRKGKDNPNYKHGLSVGRKDYDYNFKDSLKDKIKERDNFTCQECNDKENTLCVHHIDFDKLNNSQYNLITLCLRCHGKTQKNREHWKRYFSMKAFIREIFNPIKIVELNKEVLV